MHELPQTLQNLKKSVLDQLQEISDKWNGKGKPLRPENQKMVDDQGVEITRHRSRISKLDDYMNDNEIRIFSNDAGKQIAGIVLTEGNVTVQYKDGRQDFKVEIEDLKGDFKGSTYHYNVEMAENHPRDVPLNLKINGGNVSAYLSDHEKKTWPKNIMVDIDSADILPNVNITNIVRDFWFYSSTRSISFR